MNEFSNWIGRSEVHRDTITAAPVAALAATFDIDDPGQELPPLWHWMYFTPKARASLIGPDGHGARGDFLPPIALPRRMWAGGRTWFDQPIRVDDEVTRRSTIARVETKQGRSGPLTFVTVAHEITTPRGVAMREEHDLVFRENPKADDPAPAPQQAPSDENFRRTVTPDPVLLFRYSALTFNGHRIHYDRRYVTEVEGYPGLVVHGPLIGTLLLDLVRREYPDAVVKEFDFKAMSPLFDIHPFTICGRRDSDGSIALWAQNHLGHLATRARAVIA